MDIKLDSLIDKIKKDGVDKANKKAREIIESANNKAGDIVEEAKKKAASILEKANDEANKLKSNTQSSLKQAARDTALATKDQIIKLFNKILKEKISEELDSEFVKKLILKISDKWSLKKEERLEALVSKDDISKLLQLLSGEIKKQAKGEIEVKVNNSIDRGFRIGIKGKDIHYDFTDESILESLKEFLNPAIAAMLNSKNE